MNWCIHYFIHQAQVIVPSIGQPQRVGCSKHSWEHGPPHLCLWQSRKFVKSANIKIYLLMKWIMTNNVREYIVKKKISVGEQWPPPHLLLGGLIATVAHWLPQTWEGKVGLFRSCKICLLLLERTFLRSSCPILSLPLLSFISDTISSNLREVWIQRHSGSTSTLPILVPEIL